MPVYRRRMDNQNIYGGQLGGLPYSGPYPIRGRGTPLEDVEDRRQEGVYYSDPRRTEQYMLQPQLRQMLGHGDLYPHNDYRLGPTLPTQMGMTADAGSRIDHSIPSLPPNFNPSESFSIASQMQPNYHSDRPSPEDYQFNRFYPDGSRSYTQPPDAHLYRDAQLSDYVGTLNPSIMADGLNLAGGSQEPFMSPEDTIRKKLKIPGDRALSMWSLPDPEPGARPNYSYPDLVQLAILSSSAKRLTLKAIYQAIEDRFEYYKNDPSGAWKGSIRHNLSLNQIFKNVNRPITEPGKGNYWEVDRSRGEGYKRDRKRKTRRKGRQGSVDNAGKPSDDDDEAGSVDDEEFDPQEGGSRPSSSGSHHRTNSRTARRGSPYASPIGSPARQMASPHTRSLTTLPDPGMTGLYSSGFGGQSQQDYHTFGSQSPPENFLGSFQDPEMMSSPEGEYHALGVDDSTSKSSRRTKSRST